MANTREPLLKPVPIVSLRPTQMTVGMREVKEKRKRWREHKSDKKRAELNKEAIELDKKRADFIQKKLAEDKTDTKDGFDTQVLEVLRKQAMKHKIEY